MRYSTYNLLEMKDTSILLIYTGGTIGMRQDPTDGALRPVDFG